MGLESAGYILAAIAAAGSAYSASEQRAASSDQRKARREANAIKTASEKVQQQEARKQQLREARVRKARLLQSAENTGTGGGSGVVGTVSGMTSQVGSNLAFMQGVTVANEGITSTLQTGEDKASAHTNNANTGALTSQLASSGFSIWAGTETGRTTLNNLFT